MRLSARPATAADVREFYPGLSNSFRAWVCELDGKVEGIIGVALLRPIACLFSSFREALRPYLRHPAVLRIIKKAQGAVKASRVPVWAVAQEDEPTAPTILQRLGFRLRGEVDGDVIYEFVPGGPE